MFKRMFGNLKSTGQKKETPPEEEAKKSAVSEDDFEMVSLLGKGSFGKVALVRKKDTGEHFAMKVILKQHVLNRGRVRDLFSERSVMLRMRHPFITRLEYTFQNTDKLFFVMQYMPGGDFDAFLKALPDSRLTEEVARLYAGQVYLAVQHLHDNDVIYRDLKPENILLDKKGYCCLADFGLARDFQLDPALDSDRTASFVGSPFYVAPDVLQKKGYGKSVDWWSFGVLIFRMVAGAVPFSGRTTRDLFNNIANKPVSFTQYTWMSDHVRDLITGLLQKDETKRLTGAQIKAHPWFQGLDWDALYRQELPLLDIQKAEGKKAPVPTEEAPGPSAADLSRTQQALFDGFTYANSANPMGNLASSPVL
eukprot:GGOE01044428.1.p1 GENE.GGOE01044428.1~~GGOE01044428.1.p1  ORF type:complete len:402 (-),score=95.29 GGOE01044428.1:401-1495(-)